MSVSPGCLLMKVIIPNACKGKGRVVLSEGKPAAAEQQQQPSLHPEGGSKCLAVVEAQALVAAGVLCAFKAVTVLILKHGC